MREERRETGGDWRRNGGEEESSVLGGLHMGVRADGLRAVEVKSEKITLRASREQNGAVAYAQVTGCHCRWAFKGNTADAPLEITARHGGGVKAGGGVVEEIGLAGARVLQGW